MTTLLRMYVCVLLPAEHYSFSHTRFIWMKERREDLGWFVRSLVHSLEQGLNWEAESQKQIYLEPKSVDDKLWHIRQIHLRREYLMYFVHRQQWDQRQPNSLFFHQVSLSRSDWNGGWMDAIRNSITNHHLRHITAQPSWSEIMVLSPPLFNANASQVVGSWLSFYIHRLPRLTYRFTLLHIHHYSPALALVDQSTLIHLSYFIWQREHTYSKSSYQNTYVQRCPSVYLHIAILINRVPFRLVSRNYKMIWYHIWDEIEAKLFLSWSCIVRSQLSRIVSESCKLVMYFGNHLRWRRVGIWSSDVITTKMSRASHDTREFRKYWSGHKEEGREMLNLLAWSWWSCWKENGCEMGIKGGFSLGWFPSEPRTDERSTVCRSTHYSVCCCCLYMDISYICVLWRNIPKSWSGINYSRNNRPN